MKTVRFVVVSSLSALLASSMVSCASDDSGSGDDTGDDTSALDGSTSADGGHEASVQFDTGTITHDGGADTSQAEDSAAADTSLPDTSTEAAPPDAGDDAMDATTADAEMDADDGLTDAAMGDGGTPDAAPDGGSDAGSVVPTTVTILRLGDGLSALSSAGAAAFLETHAIADGSLVSTAALPIAASGANQPFCNSGSATSEGGITLSADGHYVVAAGYAATPGTAGVASSTTIERIVARVDSAGNADTSTVLTGAFTGNNVRGVASIDGTAFWAAGTGTAATGGVWYATVGSTVGTQILTAPANVRRAVIFDAQLYGVSSSGAFDGVYSVGTGVPTATATATILNGFPVVSGPSPYDFAPFDVDANGTVDTIYVADDRAPANGGGVQKWTFDGTIWTLAATFAANATSGARGVTGFKSGTTVTLLATTAQSTANTLVSIVDDGTPAPAATILATAATDTTYRGVALSPSP